VLGPRRIAFINEKGGSAKTTLAANLSAHLTLSRGHRVLAVDMDPQGQLGKVLGVENRTPSRTAIDLLLDTVLGDATRAGASGGERPAAIRPADSPRPSRPRPRSMATTSSASTRRRPSDRSRSTCSAPRRRS